MRGAGVGWGGYLKSDNLEVCFCCAVRDQSWFGMAAEVRATLPTSSVWDSWRLTIIISEEKFLERFWVRMTKAADVFWQPWLKPSAYFLRGDWSVFIYQVVEARIVSHYYSLFAPTNLDTVPGTEQAQSVFIYWKIWEWYSKRTGLGMHCWSYRHKINKDGVLVLAS